MVEDYRKCLSEVIRSYLPNNWDSREVVECNIVHVEYKESIQTLATTCAKNKRCGIESPTSI